VRVDLRLVAGRVWVYPPDPDPDAVQGGVVVVAGDTGSTVVDAGHSPHLAHLVQRAMAAAGLAPATRLVYTHHHWDHTWGACAWPDVEIIGHESGRPLLETEARRPWSHRYLRDQVAATPLLGPSFRARALAVDDWTGFAVRPPHTTFATTLRVDGLELRHVGGPHAPDSTVVAVPDSGVLLIGDAYYGPPFHLREPGAAPDLAFRDRLLDGGYDWYVASHQDPVRVRTT
jgi:glyoxylase-like metal-dependent hydrolase (beta-lactamase superfamily II)